MTTALLLVDAQRNMLEGDEAIPRAGAVKAVLGDLLGRARAAPAVVVHVQNDGPAGSPDEPDTEGWQLVFATADDELSVRKVDCDTFVSNPGLAEMLRRRGVDRVVVAGLQSEFCIRATARGAIGGGFKVLLPREAHATYDGTGMSAADLSAAVERELEDEGVEVVSISEVEFQ